MYRGQLSMPSDYQCVYDNEGGILCASTAVQSYLVREEKNAKSVYIVVIGRNCEIIVDRG